jgi:NAD(P)-dependent dehydrogenase (short-subunit alcohol dehydrogenase family)
MTGPVAIIFGGSKGIGAATARILAQEGYAIIVVARNGSDCEILAETLCGEGLTVKAMACDIAILDQVEAVITQTVSVFGRLDVVINSAGVMDPIAMVDESDAEEWGRCITINLTGSFHIFRAALPHFKVQKSGVIISLSSGASSSPLKGWSAYCTAKAGLVMLTRCVSAEVSDQNIRIYNFQPGMVNTELTRSALAHKVNKIAEELDPLTFDPPEVAAGAIAWLCQERPQDLSGGEVILTDPDFRRRINLNEGGLCEA